MEACGGVAVTITVRIEVLGVVLGEGVVGVGPTVAVRVSATETVLRGRPRLAGARIALRPVKVVAVAVLVKVRPLGSCLLYTSDAADD